MVSAGVLLICAFSPGWRLASTRVRTPSTIVAVIGAFTALFAATIAVAQTDVKDVLAYSAISQFGFMVAAIAIGGYVALVT